MENQQENQPVPEIEQVEETEQPQPGLDIPEKEQEQGTPDAAPEIETPKVPDADTEGIP